MDPQEAALKAGLPVGGRDWGRDDPAAFGPLVNAAGGRESVATLPGSYVTFYAEMAAAIVTGAPVPVSARSARDVVAVIEAARQSAVERCSIVA
jgi:scyllo-inositol 2-dehydrogenase (NADP+)